MGKRGGRGKGKVSRREGPGKAERGGDGQGGSERDCSQRQGQWEWGKPAGSGGFSGRGLDVERACHPPLEPLWFLSQASGWGQGCFCGTHPRPPSLAFASLSESSTLLGIPNPGLCGALRLGEWGAAGSHSPALGWSPAHSSPVTCPCLGGDHWGGDKEDYPKNPIWLCKGGVQLRLEPS